jgi:hypothetical protein
MRHPFIKFQGDNLCILEGFTAMKSNVMTVFRPGSKTVSENLASYCFIILLYAFTFLESLLTLRLVDFPIPNIR